MMQSNIQCFLVELSKQILLQLYVKKYNVSERELYGLQYQYIGGYVIFSYTKK